MANTIDGNIAASIVFEKVRADDTTYKQQQALPFMGCIGKFCNDIG